MATAPTDTTSQPQQVYYSAGYAAPAQDPTQPLYVAQQSPGLAPPGSYPVGNAYPQAPYPGYVAPPNVVYTQSYQAAPPVQYAYPTTTTTTTHVHVAGCPNCGAVGTTYQQFTCCGIALAIIFFPIGILCCLFMQERRCSACGFSVNDY